MKQDFIVTVQLQVRVNDISSRVAAREYAHQLTSIIVSKAQQIQSRVRQDKFSRKTWEIDMHEGINVTAAHIAESKQEAS